MVIFNLRCVFNILIKLYFKIKCRGRDSNPRRPTPIGPEPIPLVHSGTPARYLLIKKKKIIQVL